MRPAILAVDDDAGSRHVLGEIFRRDKMDVYFADSAEQALRLLDSPDAHFDLVVLDRLMSGIDGIEVLRRMKHVPRLAATPVVMQTAASAPDQISEGLLAGAHYYLTKPYAPDAMRTIVRAALAQARGRSELEQRVSAASGALRMMNEGVFECGTLEEAQTLAVALSQMAAEPKVAVVGIGELLANAIEHGNLGIDCAEKGALLRQDRWADEVRHRQQLPQFRDRRVRVQISVSGGELRLRVEDEGAGFEFARYFELDPGRAFEPNGRGIALARMMSFRSLRYEGRGNVAIATLRAARE